ncbi:MAG: molybdenum cofactor guanylyltransferase MobA [Betaproteobacteria bacterium]
MAAPSRSQVTGLVLAGGRGARMGGVDKGWVVHDGEPLVATTLRRLVPQVGSVLISANRNIDAYRALAAVVTDADAGLALEPFPGPLAGVLAGLQRAASDWVALAPCDAPALPADLVARLAGAVGDASVACPVAAERRQPVFALVRRSAAPALRAFMHAGGRAVHRWFETLDVVEVPFEDASAFCNINTPVDVGVDDARRSP